MESLEIITVNPDNPVVMLTSFTDLAAFVGLFGSCVIKAAPCDEECIAATMC
jgi:hypothetical protein